MNKFNFILKTSILLGILILFAPFFALAEAGKGISDESIILALFAVIILFVNQVFLTLTSIKKIIIPEVKSSILHYISIIIASIILAIYLPNKEPYSFHLFELFIIIPFSLGIISFSITIFNWVKKKK